MLKPVLLLLCFLCLPIQVPAQQSKAVRVRTVSLRDVSRYANRYTPHTLKLSDLKLEDIRKLLDSWSEYVLQLYDARANFRLGVKPAEGAFDPYGFLICADNVGQKLVERKEQWLNQRVNVFLRIRDMALTTNIYVGYVEKIELLDEKGKVVETLLASR